jgi:sugar O-acyltransferase (sialic acid O-acetyltransferase NeuD family)
MVMFEILMPQLGVNDDLVTLAGWLVSPGQKVNAGDEIATLETTKATFGLEAGSSGYVYPIVAEQAEVPVQTVLGLITSEHGDQIVKDYTARTNPEGGQSQPLASVTGQRSMTARARALAEKLGVDVLSLPTDRIIREHDVQRLAAGAGDSHRGRDLSRIVAVYGASEGGVAVAETLRHMGGYEVAAFLDDTPGRAGQTLMGLPIWSGDELEKLRERRIGSVASHIAVREFRLRLRNRAISLGLTLPNVIHPKAFLAPSVQLGCGNVIKAGAIVETESMIGDCCIIDNGVIVPHHNVIADAVHLAPGVAMGGGCTVGELTLVGVGAAISSRIRIGRNVIVRPGSVVVNDVPDDALVGGNPARVIGQRNQVTGAGS